jgi:hypothetical protein
VALNKLPSGILLGAKGDLKGEILLNFDSFPTLYLFAMTYCEIM